MIRPLATSIATSSARRRARGATTIACLAAVLALTACPTVDLGDQPEEAPLCNPGEQYFTEVIWPQYLAPTDMQRSCVGRAGCHRASDGRSALRLDVSEPIDYASNYQVVRRYLNCSTPDASRMLTEPLAGNERHGGGDIFPNASDPAVTVFLQWFAR